MEQQNLFNRKSSSESKSTSHLRESMSQVDCTTRQVKFVAVSLATARKFCTIAERESRGQARAPEDYSSKEEIEPAQVAGRNKPKELPHGS